MGSSGLKKMLFLIIANTEGVRVLVCPAIFLGHWMGLVVDVLPPGRCHACILADVNQLLFCIWQMLPIILWQMLLPLLCILLADVIAFF